MPQTLEEKLEDIEEYLEKLEEKLKRAFKEVREDVDEVWDSHEVLWDWHQRHCDTHKLDLIEKPSILTRFFSDFLDDLVEASLFTLFVFWVVALIHGV